MFNKEKELEMREAVRRDGEGGGPRPGDHYSVLTSLMGWMTRKNNRCKIGAIRILFSVQQVVRRKDKVVVKKLKKLPRD